MEKADIQQLADLARIAVTKTEIDSLQTEIESILEYVGQIQTLTDSVVRPNTVGAVFNKMRTDEVTNQPGEYTEAILQEMPARSGDFMKVKKILTTDE